MTFTKGKKLLVGLTELVRNSGRQLKGEREFARNAGETHTGIKTFKARTPFRTNGSDLKR